jgi:AcrR family transcriptional regulator
MGRAKGIRNDDYEASRAALLSTLADHMVTSPSFEPSMRAMALIACVNVNTLRHYFGDRNTLLAELLRTLHRRGEPLLLDAVINVPATLEASTTEFVDLIVVGWSYGLSAIHSIGLRSGLLDDVLGPVYVEQVLEPTLKACEARLARHVAEGVLAPCDLRHASLALVAPVILALLHQGPLGGATCRPLDLARFVKAHAAFFCAGMKPHRL